MIAKHQLTYYSIGQKYVLANYRKIHLYITRVKSKGDEDSSAQQWKTGSDARVKTTFNLGLTKRQSNRWFYGKHTIAKLTQALKDNWIRS